MTHDAGQLTEDDDRILITIQDETYGDAESDADWEDVREVFRLALEAEHGLPFEDADIGPGASLPAFATLLDPVTGAVAAGIAVLVAGKPIRDGLDAYLDLAGRLRKFFTRQVFLNRNGASVLALAAVAKETGQLVGAIQLIGYQPQHVLDPDDLSLLDPLTKIDAAPGTIYLGALRHIFEFDIDGVRVRASVEGKTVKTLRLPPALS